MKHITPFIILLACAFSFDYPLLPDSKLTPGVVDTNATIALLKQSGYTASVRNVTDAIKKQVFALYKIDLTKYKTGDFEVDHLISLELGGRNDIRNLWPQAYFGPITAKQKDRLENHLRKLICDGIIPLRQAQNEIATNWIVAYNFYFHTNLWALTNK